MKIKQGFLPCFSRYKHSYFPIVNIYQKASYVTKVKTLISALIDSPSILSLKQNGIGKDIQTIRPTSAESKRLISLFEFDYDIYRIDYGDNPFRIIFGLSNIKREAYILAIDTTHSTYR